MQPFIDNLALGFSVALSVNNLMLCVLGCVIGTLIGVLPGIGPIATISMLLPLTFGLSPEGSIIMLAGIYYGAQYGSSTTAILMRLPGEASSVVTMMDGHAMARQGHAGAALGVAAIGSFVAGCISTVVISIFARPLSRVAVLFGAEEYFALMLLGLVLAIVLAGGSLLRAGIAALLGVLLATVGTDAETGVRRMTFGVPSLLEGFNVAIVATGMFGIGEILRNLGLSDQRTLVPPRVGRLIPTAKDLRQSAFPIMRGTLLGSVLGVLPGSGTLLAPIVSYALEKRIARAPERFGNGAIEGVAGPESANNAAAQTSFIPLLSLGLPPNAVMALMLGALMIQGIVPGPQVLTEKPSLFWGLVASMWIGNLVLLVINLPLIGLWVSLLRVPYRLLSPAIILFCCIGLFSVNRISADVLFMAAFGIIGFGLVRLGFEAAPLLLGFVLGDLLEASFRRAMILSHNDWTTFFKSPISIAFLATAVLLLASVLVPAMQKTRALAAVAKNG